ncbi:DUF3343 domain-containing protein [Enterococcus pallens]|uniref:Putative Se/S carrier protein-like domain-containing protein n=1 Tax=Enterococcus pallens ATCC BAA-351 TaxID=1158607 RepID=R2Q9L2_9ENTE|nr:DUF3343 domain-containing protein [Enterococcus pallens]EOH93132.1 hypothetical protein UAU_02774 [Enterococcus pallens ATCC BAA-351]EOU24918.1 hypothetical protein I588_00905 [Enterococcus pallens ATCC BAA-351]OJG76460.1 hypothetical protein RV10_GL003701 [Enterococcus pallens]
MQEYGVVLFYSTHEAMKAEKLAKEAQLNVRIIPTPEKIHASCGFSLKYELAEEAALCARLLQAEVQAEGFYHVKREGLKTEYELREDL